MSGFKINENFDGLDELTANFQQNKQPGDDETNGIADNSLENAKPTEESRNNKKSKPKKRGSKAKKWILNFIIIILIGVIVVCAYNIGMTYFDEYQLENEMEDAQQALVFESPAPVGDSSAQQNSSVPSGTGGGGGGGSSGTKKPLEVPTSVDFELLKKTNGDTVGWIFSKNGIINYPIVKTSNNDYYLNRSFNKKKNVNGSIFMDYRSNADFSGTNTVIYGHSMDNGKMFKSLLNYKKQSYYSKYPEMYIFTTEGRFKLEIAYAYETNSKDMVYGKVSGQTALNAFLEHAKSKSKIKTEVEISGTDRVVSLATCAYSSNDARFIVVGKLVKDDVQ